MGPGPPGAYRPHFQPSRREKYWVSDRRSGGRSPPSGTFLVGTRMGPGLRGQKPRLQLHANSVKTRVRSQSIGFFAVLDGSRNGDPTAFLPDPGLASCTFCSRVQRVGGPATRSPLRPWSRGLDQGHSNGARPHTLLLSHCDRDAPGPRILGPERVTCDPGDFRPCRSRPSRWFESASTSPASISPLSCTGRSVLDEPLRSHPRGSRSRPGSGGRRTAPSSSSAGGQGRGRVRYRRPLFRRATASRRLQRPDPGVRRDRRRSLDPRRPEAELRLLLTTQAKVLQVPADELEDVVDEVIAMLPSSGDDADAAEAVERREPPE